LKMCEFENFLDLKMCGFENFLDLKIVWI
jgi:hypothetical protein